MCLYDCFDCVDQDGEYYEQEQYGQVGVDVGVDYDLIYLFDGFGWCGDGVGGDCILEFVCLGEEVLGWVVVEYFDQFGVGGVDQQLYCWYGCDLGEVVVFYFEQYYCVQY